MTRFRIPVGFLQPSEAAVHSIKVVFNGFQRHFAGAAPDRLVQINLGESAHLDFRGRVLVFSLSEFEDGIGHRTRVRAFEPEESLILANRSVCDEIEIVPECVEIFLLASSRMRS
ncbi:MAG: hypothetical protein M2R45_04263 [Verrucomicrobia subdivision 3 bacterium]|nr:hypothetical protein [Limisphaerales bacterium]MCS1412610.1 hypothetical protein [Limisphaerales bacterium]